MCKYLLFILFIGLIWGQNYDPETGQKISSNEIVGDNNNFKKHNLSIGILDDRTGFSFIGYTYNVMKTELDEYFIGGGTMIMAFTGTVGWKHYYKKSRLSISSVLCGQYVAHFGFMGFMPTASFTIEYDLVKWAQVKLGGMGLVMLSGDNSGDAGVLPFAGLNFQFHN